MGGPLRSRIRLQGERPQDPRVIEGNLLWCHSLQLFQIALNLGVFATLEHPLPSYVRKMPETIEILKSDAVACTVIDMVRKGQLKNGQNCYLRHRGCQRWADVVTGDMLTAHI